MVSISFVKRKTEILLQNLSGPGKSVILNKERGVLMTVELRRSRCYDICKILTLILVIIGHATVFYSPDGAMAPARQSAAMAGVATYIYSFHMPLFVLLSGCVWGWCIRHGKYEKALPFVANKAKRLLLPYLVFGAVLVTPVVVACGFTEDGFFSQLFKGILLGYDARHLWYLLVLFLLFLTTIPAKPLIKKNPLLVIPICAALFLVANYVPQIFKLRTAFKYTLFFYLGVCADHYYPFLESLAKKLRFVLPVLPVLMVGSVLYCPNFIFETAYTILGMAMMLAFSSLLTGSEKLQSSRIYQFLRRESFGLYIFHAMVIYVLFALLGPTQIPPVLLVTLSIVVSTAASFALNALVRKAKLGILLGE